MEAIRFDNVYFSYETGEEADGEGVFSPVGDFALRGVDFTVNEGEFVAVLGHNGSGKSTLARLTNGLLSPTSGGITVLGLDAASAKSYVKSHISASKSSEDSRIFVITVNTPSKAHTAEIMTALKETVPTELVSVLKPEESALNLKISSLETEINVYPVKDSPVTAAILGGGAAFTIAFIICFFISQ